MNADLENLIVLQAQDLELKRLREELADCPRRIAAATAARGKAEFALAAAKQGLIREETLRKSQELDIAGHRAKIARLQKQMESATSALQITAFEHEIAHATAAISQLEDEELASMERTETLDGDRSSAASALEATSSTLAAERERAAQLSIQHQASIAAIEAERTALRQEIAASEAGEAALSTYDRIAKAKGTAVSQAVDHKCSACQMLVRPQRWNDLVNRDPHSEHANALFTCETCGRLLFHDPRRDAPVRWSPGERLQAAGGN